MRSPFGVAGALLAATAAIATLAPLTASGAGRAQSLREAFGGGGDACLAQPGERLGAAALNACFYQSALRASRAARHDVAFETRTDADAETAATYLAAAAAAAEAIVGIAGGPSGESALAQVVRVAVDQGPAPAVKVSGGVLTVTIAPFSGDAGRPSVFEIEQAVRAARLAPA